MTIQCDGTKKQIALIIDPMTVDYVSLNCPIGEVMPILSVFRDESDWVIVGKVMEWAAIQGYAASVTRDDCMDFDYIVEPSDSDACGFYVDQL